MVTPKVVGLSRLLRGPLCEQTSSSFAVLRSPVPRTLNSRAFEICLPRLFSLMSGSSIAGSPAVDSPTEEVEPVASNSGSLFSVFRKPKSGPVPSKSGGDSNETKKGSSIAGSPAVDSPIEEVEPVAPNSSSLFSLFRKPKSRPVPSKSGGDSNETKKSMPLSSVRYRPMKEKEFPEELPPEVVALVSRLQEGGYLKEANRRAVPLNTEEVPANLYSRHILKSAAEKFGQDHQEIAKWLSGNHLKKVALFGCPSVERKTVFAAKRLRSFFRIQEDVVCRGCKMRSSCKFKNQRVARQEKVILSESMRILALLAFEAVPSLLCLPSDLKSSVCILVKEVFNLSDGQTKQT